MRRRNRILLLLLGPAPLGVLLPMVVLTASDLFSGKSDPVSDPWLEYPAKLLVTSFYAYFMVGLQSIAGTVVLEWRYRQGLSPASWRAVGGASALGALSGLTLLLPGCLADGFPGFREVALMLAWGGLVGGILGLIIRIRSRSAVSGP